MNTFKYCRLNKPPMVIHYRLLGDPSRMLAQDRCAWAPGWAETHSLNYGLKEAQVQVYMDQPEPG